MSDSKFKTALCVREEEEPRQKVARDGGETVWGKNIRATRVDASLHARGVFSQVPKDWESLEMDFFHSSQKLRIRKDNWALLEML
jgi:hypothetical protein